VRQPLIPIRVALPLYDPLEPWFDKTWRPGEIVELK
jgi:hypothetical protein